MYTIIVFNEKPTVHPPPHLELCYSSIYYRKDNQKCNSNRSWKWKWKAHTLIFFYILSHYLLRKASNECFENFLCGYIQRSRFIWKQLSYHIIKLIKTVSKCIPACINYLLWWKWSKCSFWTNRFWWIISNEWYSFEWFCCSKSSICFLLSSKEKVEYWSTILWRNTTILIVFQLLRVSTTHIIVCYFKVRDIVEN